MLNKHILITGEIGAGKTTLIKSLVELSNRNKRGFFTVSKKYNEDGYKGIYMLPADKSVSELSDKNHIADCNSRGSIIINDIFNTLGVEYLASGQEDMIIMDELGFLESDSKEFCDMVVSCFNNEIPVIAAVKMFKSEFLDKVRGHHNINLYMLTKENREELYNTLKPIVESWNLR